MRFSESELLIDQRLSHLAICATKIHKAPKNLSPRLPTLPFAAASISAPCDNCDRLTTSCCTKLGITNTKKTWRKHMANLGQLQYEYPKQCWCSTFNGLFPNLKKQHRRTRSRICQTRSITLPFYSYGHLLVITGYKWDYTIYTWGFVSTYNW